MISADDTKGISTTAELSDEELEFVAGGFRWGDITIGVKNCGCHTGALVCKNPNSGYGWCG